MTERFGGSATSSARFQTQALAKEKRRSQQSAKAEIKARLCKPAYLSPVSETHSERSQPTPKSSSLKMACVCPGGASTPSPIIMYINKISLG